MNSEQLLLIKKIVDIALRRKSILIFFLICGIGLGLAQYIRMPKVYQSTALLKYQRQSVNPTRMSPDDLRSRTRDVVDTVTQQILSRTSLEKIIKNFNLYPGMQSAMPMEDIVNVMRQFHIRTHLQRSGDTFQVSYQGKEQDKVMLVTNALAAKFIEENLRFRQEKASQTSTYIRDELSMAKTSLDQKEQTMRDYKLKYYNEMPEQLDNNTNRLNALQEQYQNNLTSSLDLERTRLLVQDQIAQRNRFLAQQMAGTIPDPNQTQAEEDLNNVQRVRQKIQTLRTKYTDKHPEIKRLTKLLQELEEQQALSAAESTESNEPPPNVTEMDPQIQELRQQMKDVEFSLERIKKERISLDSQIKKYEAWISAVPVREAEWSSLTRDYDQLNEHYQGLVTQSLQAESAKSLENQLQGSQFKIVDSAHYPEKPIKPDFKKIMLIAIGLGLGIGSALSLAIEMLDTSFKDPLELEKYLGVPLICSVPNISTRRERIKKAIGAITVNSMLIAAGTTVIAALVYFWKNNLIIL